MSKANSAGTSPAGTVLSEPVRYDGSLMRAVADGRRNAVVETLVGKSWERLGTFAELFKGSPVSDAELADAGAV